MKVRELIKKLKTLDQDKEIYCLKYDNECEAYAGFVQDVMKIKKHNDNNFIDKVEEDGEFSKIDEEDYIIKG